MALGSAGDRDGAGYEAGSIRGQHDVDPRNGQAGSADVERTATISAAMPTAISAGLALPIGRPIGPWNQAGMARSATSR